MRRLPLAAAAAASATVLAVAAPALAAGHGHGPALAHEHGSAHAHGQAAQAHGHSRKSHAAHSRGPRHVLANQLRQLNRLANFASTSSKVNDADREAVTGAVQADVDALTALRDGLTETATHRDLVNAIHHGILIRAVARAQVSVAIAVAEVRDTASDATDTAAPPGADSAIAIIVALAPDATRAEINEARHTAMAAIGGAEQADDTPGDDTTETDGSSDDATGGSGGSTTVS